MLQLFLSHASKDSVLAEFLATEIEREFENSLQVFVSSRPDAIPNGKDWFDQVMDNLEKADALVILMTETALNSTWVGFELGYFWKKQEKSYIYPLYLPAASVPSPVDKLQAKCITNNKELESFVQSLCSDFGRDYSGEFGIDAIVRSAQSIPKPHSDRSLARFSNYIDNSHWEKVLDEGNEFWICEDDALFYIEVESEETQEFREEWIQPFPAHRLGNDPAIPYKVKLKISTVTIDNFRFISVDGGRYFVPMPEIDMNVINYDVNQDRKFYWRRDSLIFRVALIISVFYHVHPNFEAFAKQANIEIR